MKKVLFVSLAMAVATTGFAQRANFNIGKNVTGTAKHATERVIDNSAIQGIQFNMPQNMVNNSRSLDDFEEFQTMTTNYDLQSNSTLGNRIVTWADGSASFTATWDHTMNTSYPNRGTGYNFYSPDQSMGEEPEARQEPMKSGWPSIAACGDGEILASHATGTNIYYRPTKGEGEWQLLVNFPEGTWPRVVCSGPNDQYIHVVFAEQISIADGYDNHVYYVRSTDGGQTWSEVIDFPGLDNTENGDYRNQLSADDYVMAANGNNVAVMFSSYTTEVFYMISHDNGATWERQIVAPYCVKQNGNNVHAIDFADYPEGMADTLFTSDNSHTIAIDNNGTVHCAFGLFAWRPADADSYNYWRVYNHGIVYWNSNFTNEQGGHEIPLFGDWSGDAAMVAEDPNWLLNGEGGIANTLAIERLYNMIEAMGSDNLNWFGYQVDENGDEDWTYDFILDVDPTWHYRTFGVSTMPGISVDQDCNVAIIYNTLSEVRHNNPGTGVDYALRNAWVTLKDHDGRWYEEAINLSEDFMHELDEVYFTTAANKAFNGEFWVMYNADEAQGTYLDISDTYPNSNAGHLTENYNYACKIVPAFAGWSINEQEAINPMTATRVYPNPATDVLNIEVNASQASEMSISVYNIMGQNVMNQNVNITTGMNTRSISTSELNSGIYFVTVKANGFENTMKFVVK